MNFDELKNQWRQQTGDAIHIREESLNRTRSITDRIRRNFRREISYTVLGFLFLLFIPFFEDLSEIAIGIYYFLLIQMGIVVLISFKKLHVFVRMTNDPTVFSTKESLLKAYYALKFAADFYRSFSYILLPTGIGLYFILIGKERADDWFLKYYHFLDTLQNDPLFLILSLSGLSVFIYFSLYYSGRWILKRYQEPLEEIRTVMDELDDEG